MKRLVLFLFAVLAYCISWANLQGTLNQEDSIVSGHILVEDDNCIFNHENNVNWELLIYDSEQNLQVIKSLANSNEFSFKVSKDDLKISNAYRFTCDNDDRVCFGGVVRAINTATGIAEEMNLKFDLLPHVPTFYDARWIDLAFTENDYPTTDSKLEFTLRSSKAEGIEMITIMESQNNMYFGDEDEKIIWKCLIDTDNFEIQGDKIVFLYPTYLDWGVYFRFYVSNKWGSVWVNETILNTDYITDPELLARIEKYKDDDTGVSAPEVEDVKIVSDDETINISDPNNEILTIRLFDASGKQVPFEKSGNSISVGSLNAGLYVLVCQTSAKQIIHKIVIK